MFLIIVLFVATVTASVDHSISETSNDISFEPKVDTKVKNDNKFNPIHKHLDPLNENSLNYSPDSDKSDHLKAINAFTDLGTSITKAAVLRNTESIIDAIGALGRAIPYLGPIAKIISGILSIFIHKPDELAEIKKKLKEMDSHLFAIENKVDDLSNKIVHVSEINYYKEHAEKIYVLQDSYQRYIETPTDITQKNLISDCETNKMLEFINFVNREITSEQLLPLMNVMKDDYNMTNFQYWSKILVTATSQAMFLHSVCLGMEFQKSADLEKTINGDIQHFHSISSSLSKITQDGIEDIKNNFFNNAAKREIHNYAQSHQGESHDNFVRNVFHMLSEKYFWRFWFVGSYNGNTGTFDKHCVAGEGMPWVYYWFRDLDRNVYISSTNNPENLEPKLQSCIDKHKVLSKWSKGHIPVNIFNDMRDCIGNVNGLGVVRFGNGLRVFSHANQDPMINVNLGAHLPSYSIFAIAPELSH